MRRNNTCPGCITHSIPPRPPTAHATVPLTTHPESVLARRRFDAWRARQRAQLPHTASTSQLLLLLPLLSSMPKVRQRAPRIDNCCPPPLTDPRRRRPRHMHRARTLRKMGGDPRGRSPSSSRIARAHLILPHPCPQVSCSSWWTTACLMLASTLGAHFDAHFDVRHVRTIAGMSMKSFQVARVSS